MVSWFGVFVCLFVFCFRKICQWFSTTDTGIPDRRDEDIHQTEREQMPRTTSQKDFSVLRVLFLL